MKPFEEIAKEAKIELTPEIHKFAWLVNHYALIDFWESAAKQAKYQHDTLKQFLKDEEKKHDQRRSTEDHQAVVRAGVVGVQHKEPAA